MHKLPLSPIDTWSCVLRHLQATRVTNYALTRCTRLADSDLLQLMHVVIHVNWAIWRYLGEMTEFTTSEDLETCGPAARRRNYFQES